LNPKTTRELFAIKDRCKNLPVSMSSEELLRKEFPPVVWIVPELIPAGLTILAGAPKMGKSWLLLGVAWALSVGGAVLGHIKVQPCEVLFLALEDTPRRLKTRLVQVGAKGSGKLWMPTQWPTGPEAVLYFDAWMLEHPNTRCIMIDTLAKISRIEEVNSYRESYNAVGMLKTVADRYGIGVVVVHHTRKNGVADDFIARVTGSAGFTGAADTIIVMARPRGSVEGVLSVTGRDVEEAEWNIRFDPDIGTWELLDRRDSWSRAVKVKREPSGKEKAAGLDL
jgi:RecA-family ATPase